MKIMILQFVRALNRVVLILIALNLTFAEEVLSSDTQIDGQMGFNFNLYQLPSSKRGQTSFNLETLNLNFSRQIDSEFNVKLGLLLAPHRDSASGEMISLLQYGYLEYQIENESPWLFQAGMVLDPIVQFERSKISSFSLGQENSGIWERYSYFHVSDQGFNINYSSETFVLGLSMMNGEGSNSSEKGIGKDFSFYTMIGTMRPQDQGFYLFLGSYIGKYELLPPSKSIKNRGVVSLGYQSGGGSQFVLQGLVAQDAIDGINLQLAEGANLLSRSGQIAQSTGGSLSAEVPVNEWESELGLPRKIFVIVRVEQLDPDIKIESNEVTSGYGGVGYSSAENFKLIFSVKNTQYKPEFNPGTDNRSKIAISTQIVF
jgi:hypothetical protein